ncbi:MAG: hypothetical protein KDD00_17220, partial [Ignavibacteriae bacterium]|nr:hypothetical protein [Ignavibacteriota bacterium]
MDKEKITPSDFKNFIEDIGVIASGSKIYTDGIQYVNNASFWKWITQSYSNSQFLNSGDSMKNFINLHKDQIKGIKSLIQGKTLEWEIFQKYRPNFIDINNLPLDTNAQISDVNS